MPINNNGAALSTRHPDGCSGVGQVLSEAAALFYDHINAADGDGRLTELHRAISHVWGNGDMSDGDAGFLYAAIDNRRPRGHRTAPGFVTTIAGALRHRIGTIFPPRREQRSPDRQASYERRHRMAYSGVMPGNLAARITHGEMAVMAVVATMHRLQRFCDLSLAEIAARAGVCRKTAKRAMAMARHAGLISIEERPQRGRKNLSNVVRIISREWLAWIAKRRPASSSTIQGDNQSPPRIPTINRTRDLRFEGQESGLARGGFARSGPPSPSRKAER